LQALEQEERGGNAEVVDDADGGCKVAAREVDREGDGLGSLQVEFRDGDAARGRERGGGDGGIEEEGQREEGDLTRLDRFWRHHGRDGLDELLKRRLEHGT
jgi:hypothetical protein